MSKQRVDYVTRLHEVCDLLGITKERGRQTALAAMFKQKQQTVHLWFTGETEPSLDTARAMALKAKVQVDWLVTGREPKFLEKQRLRPALETLIKVAEPLADYQVQQLIKIVPALSEPEPDDDHHDSAASPKKRRSG